MSPFLANGMRNYKARVHDRDGVRHVRTMGTADKAEAIAVETWCKRLRRESQWRVLDRIIDGSLPAFDGYHAALSGTLATVLETLDRTDAQDADPDLDPLVTEWQRQTRGRDYPRQVRSLIATGARFPASRFTRATISAHLAGLDVENPTRNRYRVGFMQFARWLVEREILDANPVRDVRGYPEHDPRMVHYTRSEVQALVRRLPMPQQAGEAFMAGSGMELGAVRALRRRDVNLDTRRVLAKGTKNRFRQREVKITEEWCWAIIRDYVRAFVPDAPLFPGVVASTWLRAHKRACVAAGVAVSTLHDHRHTYAIQALKDGIAPQTVKAQLGHAPGSLELERVYSAWIPKHDRDYLPRVATEMATAGTHPHQKEATT